MKLYRNNSSTSNRATWNLSNKRRWHILQENCWPVINRVSANETNKSELTQFSLNPTFNSTKFWSNEQDVSEIRILYNYLCCSESSRPTQSNTPTMIALTIFIRDFTRFTPDVSRLTRSEQRGMKCLRMRGLKVA